LRLWKPLADQGQAAAQPSTTTLASCTSMAGAFCRTTFWRTCGSIWLPRRGHEEAVKGRDISTRRMTPDQIAEAQRLAREWKPKAE
jgi:hypothetical protein